MKEPILYRIVRPIIKILFNFIFKPTYIGLENIPKEQEIKQKIYFYYHSNLVLYLWQKN